MSSFDDQNPFLSPMAETGPARVDDTEIERIRKKHLSHEASIQSMGVLYYIGAALFAIYFVVAAYALIALLVSGLNPVDREFLPWALGMVALFGGLAGLQFWVARGLRRLDSRVRMPAIVFSLLGLIGFPIGTLISAYFLWLLASKKGRYVFTKEYRDIMDATPYIRYRTSLVSWIFLGLIILLIIASIVAVTVIEN